jgi:DNA-directed RNA polymerase specialized sigma24 family protein
VEVTRSWQLGQTEFDRLLQKLSPDRERAAAEYERLRFRLTKFFQWQGGVEAEVFADRTLDRLARRLEEGAQAEPLYAYCRGIARMLLLEAQRDRERQAAAVSQAAILQQAGADEVVPLDALLKCLERLNDESRRLILDYYEGDKQRMIDGRKVLADALGIPINALRLRVNRIRNRLQDCVKKSVFNDTNASVRENDRRSQ